jgi:hypothetical protein
MHGRDPEDRPPSVTVGVGRAILSNRISHFLDIRGPRYELTHNRQIDQNDLNHTFLSASPSTQRALVVWSRSTWLAGI